MNYRAEAVAMKYPCDYVATSPHTTNNFVFLSDAVSVLQALESSSNTELNILSIGLALCMSLAVTPQWVPAHCDIRGNEEAHSVKRRQ